MRTNRDLLQSLIDEHQCDLFDMYDYDVEELIWYSYQEHFNIEPMRSQSAIGYYVNDNNSQSETWSNDYFIADFWDHHDLKSSDVEIAVVDKGSFWRSIPYRGKYSL